VPLVRVSDRGPDEEGAGVGEKRVARGAGGRQVEDAGVVQERCEGLGEPIDAVGAQAVRDRGLQPRPCAAKKQGQWVRLSQNAVARAHKNLPVPVATAAGTQLLSALTRARPVTLSSNLSS
jgi:hypothetical protein